METVRVYLMTGASIDVRCAGMREEGSYHYFEGPQPEDPTAKRETVAKFQRAAIAGFVVVDSQPHMMASLTWTPFAKGEKA